MRKSCKLSWAPGMNGPARWPRTARRLLVIGCALILLAGPVGCGVAGRAVETPHYVPAPGLDWETSTPAQEGLDADLVARLYSDAERLDTLYSLLVVKNGKLVAERYYHEGAIDRADRLQSATKSYTSALVGIAIDRGDIPDIEAKLLSFFPELADEITDPRKREITVRQLLEMRAGYPPEESDAALWQGLLSGDYPPLVEDFPLVTDPGARFHYSNLSSNWLGIIVARAAGMGLKAYGETHLFGPMGTVPGEWGTDAHGNNNGCGDLHLRPRDAAKFGQLYLDGGSYEGRQILSQQWVNDSLETYSVNEAFVKRVGRFRDIGYGYHWWSAEAGANRVNFAWGHGGQLIVISREHNVAVITTSYPFWLEHNDESWKHEKAILTTVSRFFDALPRT